MNHAMNNALNNRCIFSQHNAQPCELPSGTSSQEIIRRWWVSILSHLQHAGDQESTITSAFWVRKDGKLILHQSTRTMLANYGTVKALLQVCTAILWYRMNGSQRWPHTCQKKLLSVQTDSYCKIREKSMYMLLLFERQIYQDKDSLNYTEPSQYLTSLNVMHPKPFIRLSTLKFTIKSQ